MILGVVALARGGKDTFADYVARRYGYQKVNTSDVLEKALREEGKEPTKDAMSLLADQWRKDTGKMDIVTLKSLEGMVGKGNIIFTGFRSKEEADLMREHFPDARLIAVVADKELRYQRRQQNDPQEREGFYGRDERDIRNKGLANVLADADYCLANNGTREEFYRNIDKLWMRLRDDGNLQD